VCENYILIIEEKFVGIRGFSTVVGIFGIMGVGKSSLCNAMFGKETAKVSDIEVIF